MDSLRQPATGPAGLLSLPGAAAQEGALPVAIGRNKELFAGSLRGQYATAVISRIHSAQRYADMADRLKRLPPDPTRSLS